MEPASGMCTRPGAQARARADTKMEPFSASVRMPIAFPVALTCATAVIETTLELSRRHQMSQGRISQLRREFMEDWRAFTEVA